MRPRSIATAITKEHTVPPSLSQVTPLPKTPIKVEYQPIVIPSSLCQPISHRSTKITIPLTGKAAKVPAPSRPNAFSAFTRTQEISRLTRDLWDTRRILSAAKARESTLVQHLHLLNGTQSERLDVAKELTRPTPRGSFLTSNT